MNIICQTLLDYGPCLSKNWLILDVCAIPNNHKVEMGSAFPTYLYYNASLTVPSSLKSRLLFVMPMKPEWLRLNKPRAPAFECSLGLKQESSAPGRRTSRALASTCSGVLHSDIGLSDSFVK